MPDTVRPIWPDCDLFEIRRLIRTREVSATEVVDTHVERIRLLDGTLRACVTVTAENAYETASEIDARASSDPTPPRLSGIPIGLKDNCETAGVRTTAGSPSLVDHIPQNDAAVVQRLRASGAVPVAKTNMDEFAFGGESSNAVGGQTLNPWDAVSVPGGSSGGSGAAVAAGMCAAATGTDTGGSIRNPSAWCGVVGFKPTFGAINPAGVVPLAWSLDTVGFLAHTVRDCAILFSEVSDSLATAGESERIAFAEQAEMEPRRKPVLGIVTNLLDNSEPEVKRVCRDAVRRSADYCDLFEISLPRADDAVLATTTIILSEGAAAWEQAIRSGWHRHGPPVRAALDVGRLVRATEYIHAQRVREGLRREVQSIFDGCDALIMPSMGVVPRPGVFDGLTLAPGSLMWELEAKFTCLWNLTGFPSVSIPCGLTDQGRPIALQVVTPFGTDQKALQIGSLLERVWAISRDDLVPTWVNEQLRNGRLKPGI